VVKKFGNKVFTYSTYIEPPVKLSKSNAASDDFGKARMQN
jgi:hypothetical protein